MVSERAFVSPGEFWRRSGLSRDEVYRRLHSGELPSLRIGNRYRVPLRALDRLVEATCAIDAETWEPAGSARQ